MKALYEFGRQLCQGNGHNRKVGQEKRSGLVHDEKQQISKLYDAMSGYVSEAIDLEHHQGRCHSCWISRKRTCSRQVKNALGFI